MVQQQRNSHSRQLTRGVALTTVTVLTVLALGAGPAAARQDPGPAAAHVGECLLQRVGTHTFGATNNTGNGVPAPAWISEQ